MSQLTSTTLRGFWGCNTRLTMWWADNSVSIPYMLGSNQLPRFHTISLTDRQLGCREVSATYRHQSGPLTELDQLYRSRVSTEQTAGHRRFDIRRGEAIPPAL